MERRRNFGLGSVASIMLGLLTGIGFIIGGLALREFMSPLDDGVVVPGVLVAEQVEDRNGTVTELPYVEFVDPATGRSERIIDISAFTTGGDVGDQREVSLIPGDPSSARVVGGSLLWMSIVASGLVVIGGVIGAVWWSSRPTGGQTPSTSTMSLPEQPTHT